MSILTSTAMTIAVALNGATDLPAPPTEPAPAVETQTCDNIQMSIYFAAHDSMLSSYSRRAIDMISERLDGCTIKAVDARVSAEEAHTDEALSELSETRVNAVFQALEDSGVEIVASRSDAYPLMYTNRDEANMLFNRRVVLRIEAAPVVTS